MKNQFARLSYLIFAVLLATFIIPNARSASVVTATITVTNTAGVGTNWTVNGNSRTWTNSSGSPPSSWITTGANVGATASNLYSHIIRYPYLSPYLVPSFSSTNVITLRGSSVIVTTNNYFSVTYSTNTGTNLTVVQVPFENVPGQTNWTNNAQWLVNALNRYVRTNAFDTNATVMSNYITRGASPQQYVASPIQFNGAVRISGEVNFTNGFTHSITNINPVLSNGINFGSAFRSEGPGGNSFQMGSNAWALGTRSVAIGNGALATNTDTVAIGTSSIATNTDATVIGSGARSIGISSVVIGKNALAHESGSAIGSAAQAGTNATAIGVNASASAYSSSAYGENSSGAAYAATAIGSTTIADAAFALALGANAESSYSNSAAIGPPDHAGTATTSTTTNQVRLGTANHTVSIPGQLLISGTQSNTTFRGTNNAGGSWSYPRVNITSIANGNNIAVPLGTNKFVRLSGTVTASPAIVGMVGAATTGGTDGQEIRIFNELGYAATFTQNTVDPVAENRIETYDGNDVNVANNGWIDFVYSSSDSRWHVVNFYPQTASNTNGLSAVWTNGVSVSSAATNLNLIEGEGITLLATNASGLASVQVKNNGSISNVLYLLSTQLVATNTTVNSNLTVNYNIGAVDLFITNSISLTNHTGLAANTSKTTVLFIQPQLVNRTVVYPTLGGPSFGQRWFTNANSPMWTTLTGGVTYVMSLTSRGTNVHASISEWK